MGFENSETSSGDGNQFYLGHIRAGDIIFFDSNSLRFWSRVKRNVNVIGQRLLAASRSPKHRISIFDRIPKYSHVILGLDGGIVIHADGKSVEIEVITDALHIATTEQADYTIYRNKSINDVTRQKISSEAIRYYSQKYSFSPFFRKISASSGKLTSNSEDTTQFCSSLIAYAYRVAGDGLTDLPDNKVLPVDLFRICSLSPWENITQKFIGAHIPYDLDDHLGPITMPNGEVVMVSSFMKTTNILLKKNAAFNAEFQKLTHKSMKDMLMHEALLAQFSSAHLDLAKLVRIKPDETHGYAADIICKILEQIESLLSLSIIPDLTLITTDTLNSTDVDGDGRGAYVNFPSITVMRELQLNREAMRICAYLLFAESGIFAILAHYVPNDKYKMFDIVNRSTADRFLSSISRREDLSVYDNPQGLFIWVEDDKDRSVCQQTLKNIITGLRVIDVLRSAS